MTETAFDFPCRFPVKAMTRSGEAHVGSVLETVRAHAEFDAEADVSVRDSRNGRYQAVTVTITAVSRDQLDRLYTAVNALDAVVMTL